MLKKYSEQNCRNELDNNYVSQCLNKLDIGFSFGFAGQFASPYLQESSYSP